MPKPKIEQVVQIDTNCKYMIVLDRATSLADMEYIKERVAQFWKSDDKFMVMYGARLEKIDANRN